MKKSIIRQVFQGLRGNVAAMPMTEREDKLISAVSDAYDKLTEELNTRQKELCEKFVEAREDANYEEAVNFYVEGFKLGLLIGIECMEE